MEITSSQNTFRDKIVVIN